MRLRAAFVPVRTGFEASSSRSQIYDLKRYD
jgi:hypothetical protein